MHWIRNVIPYRYFVWLFSGIAFIASLGLLWWNPVIGSTTGPPIRSTRCSGTWPRRTPLPPLHRPSRSWPWPEAPCLARALADRRRPHPPPTDRRPSAEQTLSRSA